MPALSTKEIGSRINAHLKRFEADPEINAPQESGGMSLTPYFRAGAYASGRFVRATYVSFQGSTVMDRERARRYLAWLDGGHVGTIHDMEHAKAEANEPVE